MNPELFIARRITMKSKRSFSKLIVRIGIAGIALGLAVMIASVAILTGFKASIRDKITGFAGHIQITRFELNNSLQNSAINRDQSFIKNKFYSPAIRHIQVYASKVGIIKAKEQIEPIVLKGIDGGFDFDFFKDKLVSGTVFNPEDTLKSNMVLISKYTADRLQLKTGDDFLVYFADNDFRIRKFKISGIYDIGIEELDKIYIICPIHIIQKINNWTEKQVGGFEVFLKDFKTLDQTSELVYNGLGMDLEARSITELYPQIFDWLGLLDVNTQVILILMLVVAGINMISALLIMILERTNMIGILKALGMNNISIRKIFLYNATYLIGIGIFLGDLVGVLFCYLQGKYHLLKLDQASYYVSYVPVKISFLPILLLNIGTIIVCLLILIIPSALISKISPMKAIRFK